MHFLHIVVLSGMNKERYVFSRGILLVARQAKERGRSGRSSLIVQRIRQVVLLQADLLST